MKWLPRSFWKAIPEQVRRLALVFGLVFAGLFALRHYLIPSDFGQYGHYRGGALREISAQEVHYGGQEACADCHDNVMKKKYEGFHKNLSCEVCHGPSAAHTSDSDVLPDKPHGREFCIICHEFSAARPSGFPQILANLHNPRKACAKCHDPHSPKPPHTPRQCSACHSEIASTKSLSSHADLECSVCHESPREHNINPRVFQPSKPQSREFCGRCHAMDAKVAQEIPRVDMAAHEPRFVCWQCHYPHQPEVK